ncbi:Retrovirus-related Pol polyprotein from transposon TNT 1-94 [Quillaja saponaria]|uniref:Retrovirus-related Pol polyprotein from transposon TNT 1-94 n=1 Tax=Quillaja saponaria TaxID=32244 RepID=A0AAD7M5K1_QUISA|nr:Retrovirus-related Pol polyprotein from transposon TNT 1-94 [Quillaja saponaria]
MMGLGLVVLEVVEVAEETVEVEEAVEDVEVITALIVVEITTLFYTQRQVDESNPTNSSAPPVASLPLDPAPLDSDLPLSIRKGKRTCPSVYTCPTTAYPISNFVSYDHFSPLYYSFVTSLYGVSVPNSVSEALKHSGWRDAMDEEMRALKDNDTWELVKLPLGKSVIGFRLVFIVKVHHDGSVNRLKARLVAKGYIQVYGDDSKGIQSLKSLLQSKFQTKDLGQLKYFLGMLGSKPVDTPMDPNTKLVPDEGELLSDPEQYRRLVGKLNYLTVTRLDISSAASMVSQFMAQPRTSHWNAVIRIMRRSTTGYCVFLGGNLVSWKSKEQTVVSRSSAESEYRAMTQTTAELVWLKNLLEELGFTHSQPMELICDNQAALHIASNSVFHERTKHIEVDCHFVREKIMDNTIKTAYVKSEDQLADLFTKSLGGARLRYICNKLGTYNIYAPA